MSDAPATRHCIKCGREIGPDETICAICNRAGMATPSATQYHATVAVAIVVAVAGLAIAASLALRGVGPFDARVVRTQPAAGDALIVTVAVENKGSRAGRAKCQVVASDATGSVLRRTLVVTPSIGAGEQATSEARLPTLPEPPATVAVSCS
jgi:predicted nucleic acid-binding Zn ribbon protein